MIERRLTANGFQVVLANDGEDALEKIRKEHPDLVVMDIMMPKMNGDQVASLLREQKDTADIPIIFLTCLAESKVSGSADYLLGGHCVLSKPLNGQKLVSAIHQLLEP